MVPSWIAHALYDHCTLVSPAVDPDHSGHAVLPVTGVSVDNFWHNDLLAFFGSIGGGGNSLEGVLRGGAAWELTGLHRKWRSGLGWAPLLSCLLWSRRKALLWTTFGIVTFLSAFVALAMVVNGATWLTSL